jgi:hypothetical protein
MTTQTKSSAGRHRFAAMLRSHRMLAAHLLATVVTIALRLLHIPRCGG